METRSASAGFASLVAMVWRRFEARGDIEIVIGVPASSVRGFWMGRAGVPLGGGDVGAAVVARVRRGGWRADEGAEFFDLAAAVGWKYSLLVVDGARKLR